MRSRLERALRWLIVIALLVAWLVTAARVLPPLLGAEFDGNDWANLDAWHHLPAEWSAIGDGEVFRPLTPVLFGLLHEVLRLDARGFAVFFLVVHLLAAIQLARVFRALGFSSLAALLSAMATLISRVTLTSYSFFTQQQLTVARLLLATALLGIVRASTTTREGAPARAWLPYAALALGFHEQAVVLLPLALLALLFRDGASGLRAATSRPDVQALTALMIAYVTLHALWLSHGSSGPHALSPAALPLTMGALGIYLRTFLHALDPWTPWPGGPDLARYVATRALVAAAMLAWLIAKRGRGARQALFAAAWVAVGFALFSLSLHEMSDYFFNLAEPGVAIGLGAFLAFCVDEAPLPLRPLGLVLALASPAVQSVEQPFRPLTPSVATRLLAPVEAAVRAATPTTTRTRYVLLTDLPVPQSIGDGSLPFLGAIGADFDWNDRPLADDTLRAHALAVRFPGRDVRLWVLPVEDAPWLCIRYDDAVARVREGRPGSNVWIVEPWQSGCGAGWPELPQRRPPMGTSAAPSPASIAVAVPSLPPALAPVRAAGLGYANAYLLGDDAGARRELAAMERAEAALPDADRALGHRIVEAARATCPRDVAAHAP